MHEFNTNRLLIICYKTIEKKKLRIHKHQREQNYKYIKLYEGEKESFIILLLHLRRMKAPPTTWSEIDILILWDLKFWVCTCLLYNNVGCFPRLHLIQLLNVNFNWHVANFSISWSIQGNWYNDFKVCISQGLDFIMWSVKVRFVERTVKIERSQIITKHIYIPCQYLHIFVL